MDAEAHPQWGADVKPPPLVVNVGFVIQWPEKGSYHPHYRIASSMSEDEPGGVTVIPADMVIRSRRLATVEIPWR